MKRQSKGNVGGWELEVKNRRTEVITESKYKLRTNARESTGNTVNMRCRPKKNHERDEKKKN